MQSPSPKLLLGLTISIVTASVAVCVSAAIALPADNEAISEAGELQTKSQAISDTFAKDVEVGTILATLGEKRSSVVQPCGDTCSRTYRITGRGETRYTATLTQYSSKLNSKNYHYDRPFEADESIFQLALEANVQKTACFSREKWASYLAANGWDALKPYTVTKQIRVTDSMDVLTNGRFDRADILNVQVHGFITSRNGVRLALSTGLEAVSNIIISGGRLNEILRNDGCLSVLTVDAGEDVRGAGLQSAYNVRSAR